MRHIFRSAVIHQIIWIVALSSIFLFTGYAYADAIQHTISPGPYEITTTPGGHEIHAQNFGSLRIPGKPRMPYRIFSFAIPPGADMTSVEVTSEKSLIIPGAFHIKPASGPRVIGQEKAELRAKDLEARERNYKATYGSDLPYPSRAGKFLRRAGFRKYNLVDVEISPFQYAPASGVLTFHPALTVRIEYTFPEHAKKETAPDYSPAMEKRARDLIYNYREARAWYPVGNAARSRDIKDFVIITTSALSGSVTDLVNWEAGKGRSPEVVTVEWISANYAGTDLAQQMRNFLLDKYPTSEWGIEDVLLVGHPDNVPMRRIWQDYGYGMPNTDFYFAELSLPDSLSWDSNGNGRYGENADAVDYYSEVNVGRIPWSMASTVQQICQKSAAYEQNSDPGFKKNILLLGAFFWADTDCAILMESKVNQPWMADWSMTRMYEKNSDYFSGYSCDYPLLRSNVTAVLPGGHYAFVNFAGHGSPSSSHIYGLGAPSFIHASDAPLLDNNYPAIMFADACSNADLDYSNNIGREMLRQGAVGFVGSTKVADGQPGWNDPMDGSSQTLDYYFTVNVTSGRYTQGAAHQWGLMRLYQLGLWDAPTYEICEWTLFGNPDLKLGGIPNLVTGSVSPGVGYYGTRYEFTVQYFEAYGDPPAAIYVNIDGTDYAMTLKSGIPEDGVYRYATRDIAPGTTHTYYFHAEDSDGSSGRCPAAGTMSGPGNFNPELMLSGTPAPGAWMEIEVWGCAGALWGTAWSGESGPFYLPASGLVYDVGPGDLHLVKKIAADPLFLDDYGYGAKAFELPSGISSGFKFIQATTKVNAYWAKTNREIFVIP